LLSDRGENKCFQLLLTGQDFLMQKKFLVMMGGNSKDFFEVIFYNITKLSFTAIAMRLEILILNTANTTHLENKMYY